MDGVVHYAAGSEVRLTPLTSRPTSARRLPAGAGRAAPAIDDTFLTQHTHCDADAAGATPLADLPASAPTPQAQDACALPAHDTEQASQRPHTSAGGRPQAAHQLPASASYAALQAAPEAAPATSREFDARTVLAGRSASASARRRPRARSSGPTRSLRAQIATAAGASAQLRSCEQ